MGNIFQSLFRSLLSGQDYPILMLGLDSAGKTTVLMKLKLGELVQTVPTIGFNVERVSFGSAEMTVWDVGGQSKIRPLWRHYFAGSRGLIFVVDACDIERFAEARRELAGILEADELAGVDVLILANKMDMPGAVGPEKLAKVLDLETTASGHEWYVQASCAQTGVGLYEGLSWLVDRMRQTRTPPLSFD